MQEAHTKEEGDGEETPGTAVVVAEFTRAMMSPSQAEAEWNTYVAVCEAILSPEDYSRIGNKEYKRKSGWRKLAKVFAVGDQIITREIERDEKGRPMFAAVEVRATDPTGRSTIGYHEAHLSEKCCPTIYGDACPKAKYDDHDCCSAACTGYVHWSLPGNLPATAHTRAKNRAIADLIGAGEVSAEEMEAVGVEAPAPRERRGKGRRTPRAPARPPRPSGPTAETHWRCGYCENENPIPVATEDCPYCGKRRYSLVKAAEEARTASAAEGPEPGSADEAEQRPEDEAVGPQAEPTAPEAE